MRLSFADVVQDRVYYVMPSMRPDTGAILPKIPLYPLCTALRAYMLIVIHLEEKNRLATKKPLF